VSLAHGHAQEHDHGALHGPSHERRASLGLRAAHGLATCWPEASAGYLGHSLALLAERGHMLSDVAALGLTLFAAWIARRPASAKAHLRLLPGQILAALTNGAALIAIAILS